MGASNGLSVVWHLCLSQQSRQAVEELSPFISGLLQPLPVPHRPCSDISLDFVTGLPPSQGYTAILTVDRFSKMVHFIPMRKLPSAKGTAEAVLSQVLRIHGFPKAVVSDRGPQFISQFSKAFCFLRGATSVSPPDTIPS